MPLEQFKTQVLLLHSEQDALDKMSAGFSDRYTVHCATSGYEALNTLGETPIHVIVSSNSLPGMSGAEALREAKKRSPDTIGILLTDDNDKEAFVGDREIFQVIRGDIDPKNITKLIDAATQQVRLMTIADSANDNAAQPEDTAEHIVMETDQNGSTIVSDGTGTHAVLDPGKLAESSPVGAQAVGVLVMSKDEAFLDSIKECCRGMHNVHSAASIKQAQDLLKDGRAGVAIIDAGMVGPNVEKLAQHLQSIERRLVTIVAGRREDGEMLMDLINRGKVYRFLLKPVSPGRVRLAVDASVKHHLDSPDSAFHKVLAPEPEKAPKAAPQPDKPKAAKPEKASAKPEAQTENVINESLSSAFDDDDSRFAETVNTIVSKFRNEEKDAPAPAASPLDHGDSDGPALNVPLIGGAAAVVVIAAGLGFWLLSGDAPTTDEPVADTAAESAPAEQPAAVTETPSEREPEPVASTPDTAPAGGAAQNDELNRLLEAAATAASAGQVFSPPEENALELYSQAMVVAPGNADVERAFEAAISTAIASIETALLNGDMAVVDEGVRQVGLVQPDHPRLPFLIAQANQGRLRAALDDARAAIADGRFEDAAAAIATADSLGVDEAQVAALENELSDARSSQETAQILRVAARRLDQGRLVSPANDNARYLYELVLRNDPGNAVARQGLSAVAAKLVLNARVEMDAGRLDSADSLLRQAASIDSSSAELSAARKALTDIREGEVRAAEAKAEQEALEKQRQEEAAAAAAAAAAARPVPVSSLSRVKYVAPKYPRAAERRGISGWVDVIFTVETDGSVGDIEVRDSKPSDIFVSAAIAAVERWEFEPVVEDGAAVQKRAGVRLMFALE